MAVAKTEYTSVTMDDGRVVEFAGKRKMLKESILEADRTQVRIDFVNGETRIFTLGEALFAKFAAHGAEQKIGDEIAGLTDVDDCVLAVDELMERLDGGEWSVKRETNGMAGTSVLAKALIEHTGKSPQAIKEFLASKTQAEKVALRGNAKIAPIVARLEADKVKKPSTIDTEALLGGLDEVAAESEE